MDFTTFTTETLAHLWREGDAELEAAMPKLVRAAENRLRVDLKMQQQDVKTTLSVTAETFDLPADVDIVRSINFVGMGPGEFITKHAFDLYTTTPALRPVTVQTVRRTNILEYTQVGRTIQHRTPASVESPQEVELYYTPVASSLQSGDDTLFNTYTALYEQAVYHQCYYHLEDDAGMQRANTMYTLLLPAAQTDQQYRQMGDGPLKMQMPRSDVS